MSRSEMYIGQLVAAMYSDNLWYRARIVGCHEDLFQVFYVDYGSKNFVKLERIRHLHAHFLKMPLQVYYFIICIFLFVAFKFLIFYRLFEVEFSASNHCLTSLSGHSSQENGFWISSKVVRLIYVIACSF